MRKIRKAMLKTIAMLLCTVLTFLSVTTTGYSDSEDNLRDVSSYDTFGNISGIWLGSNIYIF